MQNQPHSELLNRENNHAGDIETHIERIRNEFRAGFDFIRKYPKSVTIFGSSLAAPEENHYKHAQELGARIASDLTYAVITGGGPGIMEAACIGATSAGGNALGLRISLPHEHAAAANVTDSMKFSYFFSRKTMLTFAAESFVFFPGGYGTFDELFSVLTLIQTEKIPRVPVVLFDSKFWTPILATMKKVMVDTYHTIDDKDLAFTVVTDSIDDTIDIIKKAPVSDWWRNIN